MLKTRVFTALVLLGLLLLALFVLPLAGGLAFFALLLLLGSWEWAAFLHWDTTVARLGYCAIAAGLCCVCWWSPSQIPMRLVLGVAMVWWLAATLWILFWPKRVVPLLVGVAGLLVLVPTWLALAHLLTAAGPSYVMYLLLLVWGADIGAYFAGRRFGSRALAPSCSPNKTWEGAAGGLLLSLLVALSGVYWFHLRPGGFLLLSGLTFAASVVGDLTESLFKRHAGLKDSGAILPGHGGVLDRIDSVTAAAPVFAFGLSYLGAAW